MSQKSVWLYSNIYFLFIDINIFLFGKDAFSLSKIAASIFIILHICYSKSAY